MRRPRTLRARVALLAAVAASVVVVVLVAAFNVVLSANLDNDLRSRLRSQAAAVATATLVRDGRVVVRESPDDEALDRGVWIFDGRRALVRPNAPRPVQQAADALAGRAGVFRDVGDSDVRLHAAALTDDGRQIGTVVAGESLGAYDTTTDVALAGSVALGGLLLAAILGLTWTATGRALAPVRDMARTAADWTEHDLAERFGATGRPEELDELARAFDGLLDRVAASLRHEQRLSAELSHELRTPLARIAAEAELLAARDRPPGERREAYAAIARNAAEMESILATLMAAARADAGLGAGRSELAPTLERLAATWGPSLRARGGDLHVTIADPALSAGVEAEVVERIAAPLLENAVRHARATVTLTARRDGERAVVLEVGDDGPGIAAEDRERVFEPGRSGARGNHGAGLGLALARRLARAADGEVVVDEPGPAGGARLRVVLPA